MVGEMDAESAVWSVATLDFAKVALMASEMAALMVVS
jgi:hypothetical protein